MTLDEFLELRNLLEVAHHVPGRLRLRLDPAIIVHPAAKVLQSLTGQLPDTGLVSVRLNPFARSLVLEYDQTRLEPGIIEEFFVTDDRERVLALADTIAGFFGVQLALD